MSLTSRRFHILVFPAFVFIRFTAGAPPFCSAAVADAVPLALSTSLSTAAATDLPSRHHSSFPRPQWTTNTTNLSSRSRHHSSTSTTVRSIYHHSRRSADPDHRFTTCASSIFAIQWDTPQGVWQTPQPSPFFQSLPLLRHQSNLLSTCNPHSSTPPQPQPQP